MKPTEAQLQSLVIDAARLHGWRVAHFRPARTADGRWRTPVEADGAGFPDLIMVRKGRMLVLEVKTDQGRLSKEQSLWMEDFNRLSRGGLDVRATVVRPSNLDVVLEWMI